MLTKDKLEKLLRERWLQHGVKLNESEQNSSPIAALIAESVERNSRVNLPLLDLWILVLDECLSWLLSLQATLFARPASRTNDFEKSIFFILSRVIADSTAMRHLALLGFDTSARIILRSLSEYLEVLVAVFHKPKFASEFSLSESPESARQFWKNHITQGKLRKRVIAAWADYFQHEEKMEAAQEFGDWGRASGLILSGLAHPSLAGGLFATFPFKETPFEDEWPGYFGTKAEISVYTISIYLKFLLPVVILSRDFPFSGYESDFESIRFDENDQIHGRIRGGRAILKSVIVALALLEEQTLPKLDLSLFLNDSEE